MAGGIQPDLFFSVHLPRHPDRIFLIYAVRHRGTQLREHHFILQLLFQLSCRLRHLQRARLFCLYAQRTGHRGSKGRPGTYFCRISGRSGTASIWREVLRVYVLLDLILLGIDSAFSLLETIVAVVRDKFGWTRLKGTTVVTVVSMILGIPFVTKAGVLWLDIVDHFAINYILVLVGIFECIAIAYFFGADKLIKDINTNAEFKLGKIFKLFISFLAPAILVVIVILSIIKEVQKPYEGYPISALIVIGLGSFVACLIGAILLAKVKSDKELVLDKAEAIKTI